MESLNCDHKNSSCELCLPNGYFHNSQQSHQHYYQNHSTGLSTDFPHTFSSDHPAYYYPPPNQNNPSSSGVSLAYNSSGAFWNACNYQSTSTESLSYFDPLWPTQAATSDIPPTMPISASNTGMMGQGQGLQFQPHNQYQYQTTPTNSFYPSAQSSVPLNLSTSTPKRAPKRKRLPKTPSTTTLTPTPKPKKAKVKPTIIDDEVALKIFRDLRVTTTFLNSGKVLAWALPPDDPCFLPIHDYIYRSQEHAFGVKILSILRIIPQANSLELQSSSHPPPLSFSEDPSTLGRLRKMLWHGTRKSHLTAILENGLQLPASHGQMFGSGIYFADRVSKSCQYCDNSGRPKGTAYLFLCDVLLGSTFEAFKAMPQLNQPPDEYIEGIGTIQYDSVKGIGNNVPDKQWDQLIDGCVWPVGPTVQNKERGDDGATPSLNFNEYIVYDTKQVQPKYLVKVEFTKQPVHENLY